MTATGGGVMDDRSIAAGTVPVDRIHGRQLRRGRRRRGRLGSFTLSAPMSKRSNVVDGTRSAGVRGRPIGWRDARWSHISCDGDVGTRQVVMRRFSFGAAW